MLASRLVVEEGLRNAVMAAAPADQPMLAASAKCPQVHDAEAQSAQRTPPLLVVRHTPHALSGACASVCQRGAIRQVGHFTRHPQQQTVKHRSAEARQAHLSPA